MQFGFDRTELWIDLDTLSCNFQTWSVLLLYFLYVALVSGVWADPHQVRRQQGQGARHRLLQGWILQGLLVIASVADPGCFIPDPGSWFLPIPDLGSRIQKQQQKRGVKKICCHNFLCSHTFHKIAHYFSFDVLKKKIWANFQRIIELFTQKIVNKLSKIWIWDPRSGIRDPGVKKAPDPGSGSATLVLLPLCKRFHCFIRLSTSIWGVKMPEN